MVAVRMVEVAAAAGGAPAAVLLLLSALFLHGATAGLSLSKKCGDLSCRPTEYCSQFDKRCHGCESVCEKTSHNFQEDVCHRDCQDYLHDLLYARIDSERGESDVEGLNEAVLRLTRLAVASLAVSVILLVAIAAFVGFLCCRINRASALVDDSEMGHRSQQGRGLASYLHAKIAGSKGSRKGGKTGGAPSHAPAHGLKLDMSAAGCGAASSGNGRQTPQPQAPPPPERPTAGTPTTAGGKSEVTGAYSPATTTSTPLSSRPPRYPSEDTTLDYAYDNRALTPSPRLEGNGGPHPPTPFHRPQPMGVKGGETTF